ncbi:MAG TPA: hypothetical protein VLS25_13105 [Dehalococcoidia bacterium]|nr:hypothetical protein [Dehalococcoidia bacterium]
MKAEQRRPAATRTLLLAIPLALAGLALVAVAAAVLAENIDPNNDNSQFAWNENKGWVNAEPSNCNNCGVHVTNTGLTGYMWGENLGWINMSCRNDATCGGPGGNWGVSNDGAGNLKGYAWAENAGWISFSCQNNPATCAATGNYGVAISPSTGIFSGYGWGENIGWISFSDTAPVAYQVQTSDADGDGVFAGSDNCPGLANAGQANADGDAFGDACDACPATADPAACSDDDNDGFSDVVESGAPLCANAVNDDSPDDALVNDGCPAVGPPEASCAGTVDDDGDGFVNDGCPVSGAFSEGLLHIGTGSLDPCGNDGWPADLFSQPPFSANKLTVQDITSFLAPLYRLNTSPGDANFASRWDLIPGKGIFAKFINVQDLAAILASTTTPTARPPMLGGQPAYNQTCPFPP